MSLMEHLGELRVRLVRSALALVVGAAVGYALFDQATDLLVGPYCAIDPELLAEGDCTLIATRPLEGFSVRISTSLVIGLFVGGPVIFYQLWRFISPGLTSSERRYAAPFVVMAQLLFGCGIAFAWFVLPNALRVLAEIAGDDIRLLLSAREYLSFILTTSVAFGLVFIVPLVLVYLSLFGLVTNRALRQARPYAITGSALLAALITPTTDPVTMLLMMGPMVVFYEVAVVVAWFVDRRRGVRAGR